MDDTFTGENAESQEAENSKADEHQLYIPPMQDRVFIDPNRHFLKNYIWFFKALARNPLEIYSQGYFKEPNMAGRMLGMDFANLSEPEAIRRYLVTNAGNYKFNHIRQSIFEPILREGVIVVEGDLWKHSRGALAAVFTPKYVGNLANIMIDVANRHADKLATLKESLAVTQNMIDITLDMLIETMFSPDTKFDVARFTKNIDILLIDYSSPHILDFIRAPKWIPRSGHKRRARVVAEVRTQLMELVDSRRRALKGEGELHDLLGLLLTAKGASGESLNDNQVVDNLLTFLAAGHDTSARSLAWTLYLLNQSPDYADKVRTELDTTNLDDIPPSKWQGALPILTAVLKESMRLYPAAGVISREAVEDDQCGSMAIKAGTSVSTSPWVLHRHELLWDNPDAFDPERFMGERAKDIPRFAYLPFGAGPRVCIGASFAMQEMIIILATYLKRFTFTHVGDEVPLPIMNITLRPSTDLPMMVEER
jgi:cytochrome P450